MNFYTNYRFYPELLSLSLREQLFSYICYKLNCNYFWAYIHLEFKLFWYSYYLIILKPHVWTYKNGYLILLTHKSSLSVVISNRIRNCVLLNDRIKLIKKTLKYIWNSSNVTGVKKHKSKSPNNENLFNEHKVNSNDNCLRFSLL